LRRRREIAQLAGDGYSRRPQLLVAGLSASSGLQRLLGHREQDGQDREVLAVLDHCSTVHP
jgi:hypothetical protein